MRPVRSPRPLPFSEMGADGYQEFRAAAVPDKRVVPIVADPLVLVEHQRGFQLASTAGATG